MDALSSFYGLFMQECGLIWGIGSLVLILFIGFFSSPLIVWSLVGAIILFGFGAPVWLLGTYAVIMAIFNIKPLRTALISSGVMKLFYKLEIVPKISETEKVALEAGVVWVEKELFSGKPDFNFIMNEPYPSLTAEEKAFMDGPVEELCKIIDTWKITKERQIPENVMTFIKEKKFLGMIVPKKYGGLGFTALAHSEVIMKLSGRSIPVAVTVMVPNSLGPAELLAHYGTEEQKNYFLPRLADGLEVPCFGLTEPLAGSDAGSITASGDLFKGEDGKLNIRLNWNKRYITLAGISTIIGLAFRLRDPQNILGKGVDLGITCGLIPSKTPGVVIGRRHDPLGIAFHNCPTQGRDVVVSVDAVVGGMNGLGKGWGMLMESLAAGRGISLPAQSTGGAKLISRVVSAYTMVRKQFGMSIGRFEAIEEPMARIGAATYTLEAMRKYTLGALDKGISPPVITAIQKYYSTELGRKGIIDAMDIVGGAGISMGPRNLLGETYIATPIGITVEGANIMTRTLIIFGQGALRAHPFAYAEVKSLDEKNLNDFDTAFWGHIGHVVRNTCRSILLSVSRGYLSCAPSGAGELAVYYRRLAWTSATFALLSDVAMGVLGGSLKAKQKITGRFADILANMYMAVSILRRFEAEGRQKEDLPFVHYSLKQNLAEIQKGFDGIFDNLEIPGLTWFFKGWIGAWSRINSVGSLGSDNLSHEISSSMLKLGGVRERLTEGIFIPKDRNQQLGRLEYAFEIAHKSESIEKKIRSAIRSGAMAKLKGAAGTLEAKAKGIINEEEFKLMQEADGIRLDAIMVDDFSEEEYHSHKA